MSAIETERFGVVNSDKNSSKTWNLSKPHKKFDDTAIKSKRFNEPLSLTKYTVRKKSHAGSYQRVTRINTDITKSTETIVGVRNIRKKSTNRHDFKDIQAEEPMKRKASKANMMVHRRGGKSKKNEEKRITKENMEQELLDQSKYR